MIKIWFTNGRDIGYVPSALTMTPAGVRVNHGTSSTFYPWFSISHVSGSNADFEKVVGA